MSRYSTLKYHNEADNPKAKPTTSNTTTRKISKVVKRCECCGREVSISNLTPKNYDSITRRAILVCDFCDKSYDRGTLDRYSYDISRVPASWLTYSYTKRESRQ